MAVNPAAALKYINDLLALISKKKKQNDALLNQLKKKAKIIDGVPYMPTGFENKPLDTLLGELNKTYGGISPISSLAASASKDIGSIVNNDEDAVTITSSKSAVEDIPLTACPTDPNPIIKKFTEDEIKKVLEDVSKECETRGQTSELLKGIDVNEAIEAKCDIIPPKDIPDAIYLNPSDLALPDSGLKEPNDSLKKPKKTLVVLNDTKSLKDPKKTDAKGGGVIEVIKYKNEGDSINCGDPILKLGTKTVTSPVTKGVLKKIYVGDKAKKGNKLFLVEETTSEDIVGKIIKESEDLGKKINRLTDLKDKLGKLEPDTWTKKIIWGIYEGQYQGYIAYFKRFNELVTKREQLSSDLLTTKKELENLIGSSLQYTTTGSSAISSQKLAQVNALKAKLISISDSINSTSSQIDVVISEQPTYFAIDRSNEAKSSIETQVNGDTTKFVVTPFTTAQKKDGRPLKDIKGDLANVIRPFSNDITLVNDSLQKWNNDNVDFLYEGAFRYHPIKVADDGVNYIYFWNTGADIWQGEMHEIRKSFVERAKNQANEIGKIEDPKVIQQKTEALKLDERTLPQKVEDAANATYSKVFEQSKQFGYFRINSGSSYIDTSQGSLETSLKGLSDKAKNSFEAAYATYKGYRDEIEKIEKEIDDFPKRLESLATGGCIMADASEPSAATIDGDKVNVIKWPITAKDTQEPADDDNFKGNPLPNSPAVTTLKYWKKYCMRATMVNLLPIYWPIGLLIPTPAMLIKIPLPIIWLPLVVVPTPLCVIVIGIALCGICPAPFVYIVNPGWPFPIGMVSPKSSWFVTGIRGPSQIDTETTSVPLAALPQVSVPLKYKENGVDKQKPVTLDIAPEITKLLPFAQDDLPAYERLSLTNLAYVMYLTKWCAAGKKTMGFFENP